MMNSQPGKSRSRMLPLLGLTALALVVVAGSAVAIVVAVRSKPQAEASSLSALPDTGAEKSQSLAEAFDAARRYLDAQQPGKAEAILRAAIKKVPENQQAHLLLGETLLQQNRVRDAYDEYDRAIFIGPDNPEYRYAAATIAAQIGRLDDAELHYRAAQQQDRANPKYPLYLAQVQRKLGYTDEAKKNLLIAAKLDPDLATAWGSLAAIALDENKLTIADQHIAKARNLDPDNLAWRVIKAQVLRRSNKPEDAVALLNALPRDVRADNPGVLLELAQSYGLLKQPDNAAGIYIDAAELQPDTAEYSYQAALWLQRAGKIDRAITYAQQAAMQGHPQAPVLVTSLTEAQ